LDIVAPSLHDAASKGDLDGVRNALATGADVNALNDKGWSVLTCTIAGNECVGFFFLPLFFSYPSFFSSWSINDPSKVPEITHDRLNILRTILRHPSLSLLTMNSPLIALNGVTPLGFAAWLNSPLAVSALLKYSLESVAVDGMDSNRATPLMCT
jgi:ankyrin repeat protein